MKPDIAEAIRAPFIQEGLDSLSDELGETRPSIEKRFRSCLSEMWTWHDPVASQMWKRFGDAISRRYRVLVDRPALKRVVELDRAHPLVVLSSHRSYLDAWILREAIRGQLSPVIALAGANLNFWPMGPVLRRTGALFIRRSTTDDPVYRFALRSYMRYLLESRCNLGWSIEGGRTRSGKLRPPRYGALRYVVDGIGDRSDAPEVYAVPVSVVYDQLGEVATMAAEAVGGDKKPEDLRWLLEFSLRQTRVGGIARIDFGEPVPMRERIAELKEDPSSRERVVERVALAVCHGINQVTPATSTAVVTFALLGAERALTTAEVIETVRPLVEYLMERAPARIVGVENPTESSNWVRQALEELYESGVLTRFDGGDTPVYRIAPDQHLVAAFYRNTLIHLIVDRAIGELTLFRIQEGRGDLREQLWDSAVRLRALLKFEFFFARRREFQEELWRELDRLDPEWEGRRTTAPVVTADRVQFWFERLRPHVSHLALRPFLDAYRLVATELAKQPVDRPIDREQLLTHCVGVGQQWVLQRKLHSPESVTLELFRNALKLSDHLGLLEGTGSELQTRRQALADELTELVQSLRRLEATRALPH